MVPKFAVPWHSISVKTLIEAVGHKRRMKPWKEIQWLLNIVWDYMQWPVAIPYVSLGSDAFPASFFFFFVIAQFHCEIFFS